MKQMAAHLHPLLVHLPIGILLLLALFALLARYERYRMLAPVLPLVSGMGMASAWLSCVSGWLLATEGGYDAGTLQVHRWLGIATAVSASLLSFLPGKTVFRIVTLPLLLAAAGLGAVLTHGSAYFSPAPSSGSIKAMSAADLQEAPVFDAVIAPLLREKCVSCHGSVRQKGGLRLDQAGLIEKGGKSGRVLPDPSGNCELLRRCQLPAGHEDHMPPKEKKQLSPEELELLAWWIKEGADFQKRVKELRQTETIRQILIRRQNGNSAKSEEGDLLPESSARVVPESILQLLRQSGMVVLPLSRQQQWLSISFVNLARPPLPVLESMANLKDQTLYLNLSHCILDEGGWSQIAPFKHLRRLSLDHSNISDKDLVYLKGMDQLRFLNLSNTGISLGGLRELAGLANLQKVFLYRTAIGTADWPIIRTILPKTEIDSGNLVIPFLDTDTARIKAPMPYR